MGRTFEVQRDQGWLLERTRALLRKGGTLYFSTNFRGFELDAKIEGATELTPRSLPGTSAQAFIAVAARS